MRTRADLEGAFALLEQEADSYAAATATPETGDGADVTAIALTPAPRSGHRRRARLTTIGAAAAVAALAVGVASWVGSGSHDTPTGGEPAHPYHKVLRNLPFTIDPALHLTVGFLSSGADFALSADLYTRSAHLELTLRRAHDGTRLAPGLRPVRIDGKTGYYADGSGPAFAEPAPTPTAAGAAASSPAAPDEYAPMVVWQYAPHAWATLFVDGSRGTESGLLRAARGLRFDGKSHPVHTPLTVTAAPEGMRLTQYDVTYAETPDTEPPYRLHTDQWVADADYYPTHGNGVSIAVIPAHDAHDRAFYRQGTPTTVNGHPARIKRFPNGLHVMIDLGDQKFADIMENTFDGRSKPTMTAADLAAVGATVRLVANPDDQHGWPTITKALP